MAFFASSLTVTTTEAAIPQPSTSDSHAGMHVELNNTGAETVYVGGPGVTTTTGTPVLAGEQWYMDHMWPSDIPYVITASGSSTLSILWTGV